MDESSRDLLARYRAGDDAAADALFNRYVQRLTALARSRLSPKLARRVDPEDIVMSAYRSFFLRARAGRFSLHRGGDLWRLLVAITLHKLYRQAAHHSAERRSVDLEVDLGRDFATLLPEISREPRPEEAAALADELNHIMSRLPELERRLLELRLQGLGLDEIATETNRSERTVRRILKSLRERLADRFVDIKDEVHEL